MHAGTGHFPDPEVTFGSFKVLPRTDGLYVVVDTRRKPGNRVVGQPFKKMLDAKEAARTWHEQGHG